MSSRPTVDVTSGFCSIHFCSVLQLKPWSQKQEKVLRCDLLDDINRRQWNQICTRLYESALFVMFAWIIAFSLTPLHPSYTSSLLYKLPHCFARLLSSFTVAAQSFASATWHIPKALLRSEGPRRSERPSLRSGRIAHWLHFPATCSKKGKKV